MVIYNFLKKVSWGALRETIASSDYMAMSEAWALALGWSGLGIDTNNWYVAFNKIGMH